MKIMTFSLEKLERLMQDIRKDEGKLRALEESTIEDLWSKDLDKFEEEYRRKCHPNDL
jgi:hypothetical protein